ncbi:MAG: hypothetical protein EBU90_27785 [Proteobacteria bacterium]|nr:hypothetical protein [Pseudomonadota bacterium]
MPRTAQSLGTSTDELKRMSAVDQLDYVERYYKPIAGKAKDIGDLYMFTFIPAAVGKPDDFVIGVKGSDKTLWKLNQGQLYAQNKVFDKEGKGYYTVGDIKSRISGFAESLEEGWKSSLAGLGLAAATAMNPAQARVSPDDISKPNFNSLTGKPHASQAVDQTKSTNQAAPGFSDEYLKKAADPNRFGRYMISVDDAKAELEKRNKPKDLGNGFETHKYNGLPGVRDTESGVVVVKSKDGSYGVIDFDNGQEKSATWGVKLKQLGPATQKALQQIDNQQEGVAEGGDQYKVKSVGRDTKGDYYVSPKSSKKVYKSGVKVGDHENPKSGQTTKQVPIGEAYEKQMAQLVGKILLRELTGK